MLPSGESWVMRGRHSQSLHTRRAACGHIDRTAPPPSPCGKGRSLPPSPSCTLCAFSFLAACCCAALLVVAGVPPTLLSSPAPTLGLYTVRVYCSCTWYASSFPAACCCAAPPGGPGVPPTLLSSISCSCTRPVFGVQCSLGFLLLVLGLPLVPGYIYFIPLVPPTH